MPTSQWEIIPEVISIVKNLNPVSILDVGVGFGKWGVLFREYLEVWEGRYYRKDWQKKIDGVEVFKLYLNPAHSYFYDKIYLGDIRDMKIEEHYDLIFLGDVIEHFEKEEAIELINRLSKLSNLVVTTPDGFYRQDSAFGNPYEVHKSGFKKEDFVRWKGSKIIQKGIMLVGTIPCQAN